MRDAVLALQHMHGKGITHRDLHGGNFVLMGWLDPCSHPEQVKGVILDFGLCHVMRDKQYSEVGAAGFRQPRRKGGK